MVKKWLSRFCFVCGVAWQWSDLVCWEGDTVCLYNWILCVELLLEGSQRRQSWGLEVLVKTQVVTWMWNVNTERVRGEWGNRNDTLLLVVSSATMQVQRGKERETLSVIWLSHHRQCSHICGAEGVGSKNQPWANSAWLPLRLTWEWQDYAILQANPFSNQLTQHHIWGKMWFGLDFARICQFFCRH